MSGTLPIASASRTTTGLPLGDGNSFDLVAMLLTEQQTLTAVEDFAWSHERGDADESAVTGPDQARHYSKLMPASSPGPNQQLAFNVNLDACSGCKACVVACHAMNGLDETESWRRVGTLIIGENDTENSTPSSGTVGVQHVTTACHHCEDPGCLNGCPVKAYDKDPITGIVRHLDDQCIGCKYCTMMCPYEVPKYSKRLGIVRKCDMCHQRLSVGEAPACVQSCPNEAIAIRIVSASPTISNATKRLAPGAPPNEITRPTTVYTSDRKAQLTAALPQDHRMDEPAENHWPLAALLVATQIGMGMLCCERIVAAFAWLAGAPLSIETTRGVATVSLVVSLVGLNLAPLHLGQPLRAWRVFLGLRTSWLSREAILLGKFVGLLSVAVGLMWLPTNEPFVPSFVSIQIPAWVVVPAWAAKSALGAAIFFGAAGLYSSAMIYIATRRQLWRPMRTFVRFLGTSLVAGLAASGAVFCLLEESLTATAVLASLACLSTAAKLIWEQTILLSDGHGADDEYDRRSRRLVRLRLGRLGVARLALGWGGAGMLIVAAVCAMSGLASPATVAVLLGALLVSAGEYAERLLYFSSVVYDRMPGTLR